jgi:hypothetical protein
VLQIPINSILVSDREVERDVCEGVKGQCAKKLLVFARKVVAVGEYLKES